MSLCNLDAHIPRITARLFSCEDGLTGINSNFGFPFVVYGPGHQIVELTPGQSLKLLAFLEENKARLEQLAMQGGQPA